MPQSPFPLIATKAGIPVSIKEDIFNVKYLYYTESVSFITNRIRKDVLTLSPFHTCLRGIECPIADTKIFYAYGLENLHSNICSFRSKVIHVIVSQCNCIKSCKPNEQWKTAALLLSEMAKHWLPKSVCTWWWWWWWWWWWRHRLSWQPKNRYHTLIRTEDKNISSFLYALMLPLYLCLCLAYILCLAYARARA